MNAASPSLSGGNGNFWSVQNFCSGRSAHSYELRDDCSSRSERMREHRQLGTVPPLHVETESSRKHRPVRRMNGGRTAAWAGRERVVELGKRNDRGRARNERAVPRLRFPSGKDERDVRTVATRVFDDASDVIEVRITIIVFSGPILTECVNRLCTGIGVTAVEPVALRIVRRCEPVDRVRTPQGVRFYRVRSTPRRRPN